MVQRRWVNAEVPVRIAKHDGLAYSLWLPSEPAGAGVVILHGAGSCKESHHDYARVLLSHGFAALVFDQRGHGDSPGPMDARALADVVQMASLLRAEAGTASIVLRGSSMGGYLALVCARAVDAVAVVAICPASAEGLRRGLRAGTLRFAADVPALDAVLAEHELDRALDALEVPVLLLHAEGDEQVPVEHSRELATRLRHPMSRLIALPGGHHRSIQHDEEMQAVSVRFLDAALKNSP